MSSKTKERRPKTMGAMIFAVLLIDIKPVFPSSPTQVI